MTKNEDSKWQLNLKWLMVICFLSLITHGYLSYQHYVLKLGISSEASICNINSVFNCDSVATSEYSSFLGIPVAVFGLSTHVISLILLVALFLGISDHLRSLRNQFFILSTLIGITSFVMAGISLGKMGVYCLFCIGAYILSYIQFYFAYRMKPKEETLPNLFNSILVSKWSLILIIIIPGISWMGNSVVASQTGLDKLDRIVTDSIAEWSLNVEHKFEESNGVFIQKSQNSKITVVEFADFLCPHCKMASASISNFLKNNPDVNMLFKFFPLDGVCNPDIPHKGDGIRCKLAALVQCSETLAKQGAEITKYTFENQENFLGRKLEFKSFLSEVSGKIAIPEAELEKCISSDATQESLSKSSKEGVMAKIQGTPTIFVNGRELPRGQSQMVLEAITKKIRTN